MLPVCLFLAIVDKKQSILEINIHSHVKVSPIDKITFYWSGKCISLIHILSTFIAQHLMGCISIFHLAEFKLIVFLYI